MGELTSKMYQNNLYFSLKITTNTIIYMQIYQCYEYHIDKHNNISLATEMSLRVCPSIHPPNFWILRVSVNNFPLIDFKHVICIHNGTPKDSINFRWFPIEYPLSSASDYWKSNRKHMQVWALTLLHCGSLFGHYDLP